MSERAVLPAAALDAAGLNRQCVFDLAALPAAVLAPLGDLRGFRQLLLIGHAGRRLWACVQAHNTDSADPIDDFTVHTVSTWFSHTCPGRAFRFLYPGTTPVGLQRLGELAGWHAPSPLMIGVDAQWGSWYAYRAVVVVDADFRPSPVLAGPAPCTTCRAAPCIAACPAGALAEGTFNLVRCSDFRLQPGSPCASQCLARLACPVGAEHRYEDAQIRHSYTRSLSLLRAYRTATLSGGPDGVQPVNQAPSA